MVIDKVEKDIKKLIESNLSTNQLSRSSDISMSTISKIRNGKASLDNISFQNIKKLHKTAVNLNDTVK